MNKLPSLQDVQDARERTKAILAEQKQYFDIAWDKYRDNSKAILRMDNYTKAAQYDCIAECAYILEHKAMPEWAYLIESFETLANGDTLFIHRDKEGAQ
jgi:hypothetical protein